MRIFHFLLKTMAALALLLPAVASAQLMSSGELHVPASLVAETDHPAPGQTVTLAFTMKPQAGWHGYWENPGDAGTGMTLKWDLPSGVTVSALRYPVPEPLLISGLMTYVYADDYAPLVDRMSVVSGESVFVRVERGGGRCHKQKNT